MESTWWTRPDQLDHDQKKAIALPLAGSHLIVGPPGSGKTNLVLLRAAYLQAKGKSNFLVFTFGRLLREFLARGTDATRVSPDKIVTYISWATTVVQSTFPKVQFSSKFPDMRREVLEYLQTMTESQVAEHRLDCILLDECQDYPAEEIAAMLRFSPQIYAAGDNRQRIYQDAGAIETLEKTCSKTELQFHYRNGRKICKVADGIMDEVGSSDGLTATSQYNELEMQSRVSSHPQEDLVSQVSRCIPELTNQLRAYPQAMIGVLCPRRPDVKEVASLLAASSVGGEVQLQLQETGYEPIDPSRRILVGTISGAKGLEFRAVHLLGMDRLSTIPNRSRQTRLAYTAVTRAKTSLDIYSAGDLNGRLDNGLNALRDRLKMLVTARLGVIQARDVDPRDPWPDGRDCTQDQAVSV